FVTKRRMAEVVRQRDRFRQVFVQPQRPGYVARNGGYFYRVREPRAQVVPGAVEKNLGLVFEPPKGAGVNDPVAVALVFGAPFRRWLRVLAPARLGAQLRIRGQVLPLQWFQ